MVLSLLISLSVANAKVDPLAYNKVMHCGFKIKDERSGKIEKHSFYLYSSVFGGPSWVAFRDALYSSEIAEVEHPQDLKKVPANFEFRIGEMGDGSWQAHVLATLERIEEKNKKRIRVGKINIVTADGKTLTAPIRCR